jgi:5'-nucleotidase
MALLCPFIQEFFSVRPCHLAKPGPKVAISDWQGQNIGCLDVISTEAPVRRSGHYVTTLFLFSAFLGLGQCSTLPDKEGLTLRLIHINDTHSHFDATAAQVQDPLPDQTLYTYIGGHPRLLTMAEQQRAAAQAAGVPSLFLHGGDAFKGSAYFELFEHKINIDILNRMGLDAMALGNHEFDVGVSKLAEFIDQVNFPVLAANVDVSAEPALINSTNLKPYSLFVLDGTKLVAVDSPSEAANQTLVGVFGLALEDMPTIAPGTGSLIFDSEVAAAQQIVDDLHKKGINHIVALTHLGHQRDLGVARAVNGIDVIVGGHSHSLLGDFRHWFLGEQPPYAQMISNPDGYGQTCVVQAGQFAQAMGMVEIRFDRSGQLLSCTGENTLLASRDFFLSPLRTEQSRTKADRQAAIERHIEQLPGTAIIDEHQGLRQRLDSEYLPAVQQAYGRQIAMTGETITHVRLPGSGGSDQHGSVLAGHIADGMYYWLNQPATQQILERQVDFTLIGAGNIRASLEAGAIYEGHIRLEVLPFDTPLSVLYISGAELTALLTDVIGATLPAGAHAGKYPYNSHLRYIAEEQQDGTALLTQLQVLSTSASDSDSTSASAWHDIAPNQLYVLATTNYLADGNDGWDLLAQVSPSQARRVDLIIEQQQVVLYQPGADLPCDRDGVDCKVAAQAVIDYLIADPSVIYNNRLPTVTLLRPGN